MSDYTPQPNTFTLFANDKGDNPKRPDYKGDIILVVAEPAVIPALIPEFQGSKKVPAMEDGEYDNLYVVSIPWYGRVKTLRLRYGARHVPLLPASPPAG